MYVFIRIISKVAVKKYLNKENIMKNPESFFCHFNSRYLFIMLLISRVFLLSNSCSSVQTKEMALQAGNEKLDFNKGSLCLLSIKT
jgi:hypothetical protein